MSRIGFIILLVQCYDQGNVKPKECKEINVSNVFKIKTNEGQRSAHYNKQQLAVVIIV